MREKFHQTERKKVEEKCRCRFIKDDVKHAEAVGKKRAGINNAEIQLQCSRTRRRRGMYKQN